MVVRVTNLNVRQPSIQRRQKIPQSSDSTAPAQARLAAVRRSPRALPPQEGSDNFSLTKIFNTVCLSISITLLLANFSHLSAQEVTTVAPPSNSPADTPLQALPDAPGMAQYPDAVPIPPQGTLISIVSETQSTSPEGIDILGGNVVITYGDRILHADHVEYDTGTGDVALTGHVVVDISSTDEHIEASHGTINVRTQAGRFYDVTGSVGLRQKPTKPTAGATSTSRGVYANGNPFLFTGKLVVKTGPRQYQIYSGTITSCQLPRPDWLLSGAEFSVEDQKAHANNTIFRLLSIPVLWLPFVTHPVDASDRQTGILIPEIGFNSSSKGDTVGEQLYWAINRSTDLTVGTIYYSARGWEQTASFRYRGLSQDFVKAHYSGLQDRGYYPGGVYVNQSGTDVVVSGRKDLIAADDFLPPTGSAPAQTSFVPTPPVQERAVADLEYLSSFPYREAFSTNFNQAVSSDVISTLYLTRESDGMAVSLEGDRYQGEKRVANTTVVPPQTEQQVHIFHAPALEFTTTDHSLGSTGLEWDLNATAAALKRTQPNFETSGMIERLDVRPELAYPLGFAGWRLRPSLSGRETFYSRSKFSTTPEVEDTNTLNRADFEFQLDTRAPVLERTFDSGFIRNLFRRDVKHTIAPYAVYRYVTGVNQFQQTLRFDEVDIASDTNEVEYGVTQRLFLRHTGSQPCRAAGSSADATEVLGVAGGDAELEDPGEAAGRVDDVQPVCGNREWISWRVAQKYFFNSNFGGAVTTGPRAILGTTLDFSGISFMTRPRDISPLISRLRVRPSDKLDVEWDFDYDTCSASSASNPVTSPHSCNQKFTANNLFVDVHQGNIRAGAIVARLNAPARSYVEGTLSSVADFTQMRFWVGFRDPTKVGFSAATNAGIDLDLGTVQYGAIQTAYNWNCCGVSIEYRKYELGSARNDNGYKFNFTLANIGSAGNIKHSDQVF
jgi:LPS-assembly protein